MIPLITLRSEGFNRIGVDFTTHIFAAPMIDRAVRVAVEGYFHKYRRFVGRDLGPGADVCGFRVSTTAA
jgi:hypothetical protein